jgi:acetyl/propionyl-CoA carboxylase alpha subunit
MTTALTIPIRSVLIANRGEIARRIIRSCRSLGISTVAVYAPADVAAPYVTEATTAVPIPAAASFLDPQLLTECAVQAGVDAVHPGYGFLSENPGFVEALSAHSIRFIGPSAASMRALGDKASAKEIAARYNVPIASTLLLEGISDALLETSIRDFGHQVGFPLMVKAAAGGGGRGMRALTTDDDIREVIQSASREAERAFGRSRLFVEKLISPARHIEVQILADTHGAVVAVGTRDCSLQRSNQKIMEEGPAPFLPVETETAIMKSAVLMAQGAQYSNAGTVEFLLSPDGRFYFLEVNSRLQVEHPVTEMVTGRDLVADQLRIAEGASLGSLGLTATPARRGHAIEARVCAEAFDDSLSLSVGEIQRLVLPKDTPPSSVRYEFGYREGSSVSHDFDSLLGKVIAWGETREEARNLLTRTLSQTHVSGVRTNSALVLHLLNTPEYISGSLAVQNTPKLLPSRDRRRECALEAIAIVTGLDFFAAHYLQGTAHGNYNSPWRSDHRGFALVSPLHFSSRFSCHTFQSVAVSCLEGRDCRIRVEAEGLANSYTLSLPHRYEATATDELRLLRAVVLINGVKEDVTVEVPISPTRPIWLHRSIGTWEILRDPTPEASSVSHPGQGHDSLLTSPLPGRVVAVRVKVGDQVVAGTTVAVLDSMKMEHPIRAAHPGLITEVHVAVGQTLLAGALIASIVSGEG